MGIKRQPGEGLKLAINQLVCKTGQPIKLNDLDDSDTFNQFFCRFEKSFPDSRVTLRGTLTPQRGIIIQQSNVTTLLKTKIGKAPGPDAICGRTLSDCAEQLSEVFIVVFQKCADSGEIPDLWKMSTPSPRQNLLKILMNSD